MARLTTREEEEAALEASRAPLLDHLNELRDRLIRSVIAIAIGIAICYAFADPIFGLLVQPFKWAVSEAHGARAAESINFIFNGPLEFFLAKIKIAIFGGLVLAFPVIAYQIYAFVAPGLYKHERGAVAPFLIAAPLLFAAGASLVYFLVLKMVMRFALSQETMANGVHVELLPKVSDYLSLTTALILAFGVAFQLPLVLVLLGKAGIITARQLREGRRFAILLIVIFAAVITPPDVISQLSLAVPMCLLYEGSIFAVLLSERSAAKRAAEEEKNAIDPGASPAP
jgi:sec-independent protein translocase protein TatC